VGDSLPSPDLPVCRPHHCGIVTFASRGSTSVRYRCTTPCLTPLRYKGCGYPSECSHQGGTLAFRCTSRKSPTRPMCAASPLRHTVEAVGRRSWRLTPGAVQAGIGGVSSTSSAHFPSKLRSASSRSARLTCVSPPSCGSATTGRTEPTKSRAVRTSRRKNARRRTRT
jgi:hypothetical protein